MMIERQLIDELAEVGIIDDGVSAVVEPTDEPSRWTPSDLHPWPYGPWVIDDRGSG